MRDWALLHIAPLTALALWAGVGWWAGNFNWPLTGMVVGGWSAGYMHAERVARWRRGDGGDQ
jgi:hypothetical protein